MPDIVQIVELLVDSAQAVTGAEAVIPPLEEISLAAKEAAAAVDKLGVSLDAVGVQGAGAAAGVQTLTTAVTISARAHTAQEAALVRQSTAAGGVDGALKSLAKTSNDLTLAQAALARDIMTGGISAEAGAAEYVKLKERQAEVTEATEKLRDGHSSLAGVLVQFPTLLSALGAGASKVAGNHAELADAFEKFRTGGLSVASLVQQFPNLLGNVSAEAKSLVSRWDELSTALSKYSAGTINAATVTAAFPRLVSAAGSEVDKLAINHANLLAALEKFKAGQLDVSALVTAYPAIISASGSSLERYVKQHVEAAAAVIGAGAAHRGAVAPVKELDEAIEHQGMNIRQTHGIMVLYRALLDGDWKRAVESATVSAERFHLIHIAMQPAVLLTGAALLASAAAFFFVAEHVLTAEANLRSFNLQLSTIANTATGQTAQGLQELDRNLRDTGTTAAEAKKAIDTVLQATPRGINPDAANTIVPLARDIGAATGTDTVAETKKLTDALAGGVDEMIKYGFAVGALSAPQAAAMRQLEEHGRAADAMRIAIDALTARYGGAYEKSLSDTQKATIALKNAWDDAIEALSKTGVFDVLLTKFKDLAIGLKGLLEDTQRLKGYLDTFGGALGGAAVGARVAGVPGAIVGGVIGGNVGVSGVTDATAAVGGAWASFSKWWDDVQQTLGHGRPSETASAAANDNVNTVRSAATAQEDLAKALADRGATEQEVQRTLASGTEATNANTQAIKALTEAAQKAPTLSTGGAIQNAAQAVGAGSTADFFGALMQLESSGQNITQGIQDVNSRAGTPAQGLFQITDPTWRQFASPAILGQYSSALQAPADVQRDVVSNIPLSRFGPRTVAGLEAQFGPLDKSQTIGALAGTSSQPLFDVGAALGGSSSLADQQKLIQTTETQTDAVNKQAEANRKNLVVTDQVGAQRILAQAQLDAENKATAQHIEGTNRENFIAGEMATAKAKLNQQYQQGATLADLEATGTLKTADAYSRSAVEGLKASAMLQAQIQSRASGIPIEQAYNQVINKSATDALLQASQRERSQTDTLARNQQLADASLRGTAAEHEAQIQVAAEAASYDVLNKTRLTGNEGLIQEALAREKVAEQQERQKALQGEEVQIGHALQQGRDRLAVSELELSLAGQTREEIQKQVSILQAKETFAARFPEHARLETDEARAAYALYVGQAAALADSNIKLAQAQRWWSELNDLVRNIGDQISTTLGTAIEDAFNGKKVTDWGAQIKTIIAQVMSEIVQFTFIKPLIGTALTALGLNQAAQQFGGFGGITGALGGTGSAGGGGTSGLAGDVGQVASIGKSASGALDTGGSSGGIFGQGGFSSFLNNDIGGALGFATRIPAAEGITQGLGPLLPDAAGNVLAPGSLFGATSLGGFLGGAGAGFGAGTLLNSLLGGNQLTGTVGSGFGSLGGAAIGTLLGGPIGTLLGGLLGGSGGGVLGGLIGPKPSNFSSGDVINVGTGAVSGFQSSGNAQNDQTVKQISTSISQFTESISKIAGVTLPTGALNIQAGTKEGILAAYTGSAGNINAKFADADSAITAIEQAILQNLSATSDTLKTVLAHVTDPAQLQAAVTFAATYDDLKKASDSAFSSIATDVKSVGPFAQALTQLQTTFAALTDQANQFGLSLDPINAGLAEATKRLQQDFGKALDQALNTANSTQFVDQLAAVSAAFVTNSQEANAIGLGGDAATTGKIAQLEAQQAQALLSPLTAAQLQTVVDQLGTTNPEISAMAQALLDAGKAADVVAAANTAAATAATAAAAALSSLTSGIQAITTLSASLKSGALSGLPPAAAVTALSADYQTALSAATAAGTTVSGAQLTTLATTAQAALQASQTAYGEGPQTADLRSQIAAALNAVNAQGVAASTVLSAAATAPTAPIAQTAAAATTNTAAVQASQAAVAAAAIAPAATATTAVTSAPAPAAAYDYNTLNAAENALLSLRDTGKGGSKGDVDTVFAAVTAGVLDTASPFARLARILRTQGFAAGTDYTPAGTILVGEAGPELIHQPGGLAVTPISDHPAWSWAGAGGGASSGGIDVAMLEELRALRAQVAEELPALRAQVGALTKQLQGGQIQAATDAQTGNATLADISRNTRADAGAPARNKAA